MSGSGSRSASDQERLCVEDHPDSICHRLCKYYRPVHLLRFLVNLFRHTGALARDSPGDAVPLRERFNSILEGIGWLTITVVALELGQTVLEEEVLRSAQVSAPTRVRRFLSRFMVVVVVALSMCHVSMALSSQKELTHAHTTSHLAYQAV